MLVLVDLVGKLLVSLEVVCSSLRPGIVLGVRVKVILELTVSWEDSIEEAFERK